MRRREKPGKLMLAMWTGLCPLRVWKMGEARARTTEQGLAEEVDWNSGPRLVLSHSAPSLLSRDERANS